MGILLEKLEPSFVHSVSDAVDVNVIDALIEDTSIDFFPSLLEVFETESYTRVENINNALIAQDAAALGIEAHSLKGTSATFGAEPLRSLVYEIERAGKEGDLSKAAELVPQVAPLHARVVEVLQAINSKL